MFRKLCRVASPSSVSCVKFVAQCHSHTLQSLEVPLVNSRLDYGNGALIGLPAYLTRRLRSVLNACARLIFNLRRSDHVSDAPISLHWLRVPERSPSCRPGVQGSPRLCTVVPWPVHLRCRPSKSPRTSLFLQRLPRPASGSPLHCWQPNIFGCWPSGVELPATGGYVGTVPGDLPHSTQDVPVH